jgi:hypothetical protein
VCLGFERDLNAKFPVDKKYGYETRGAMTIKTYSQEYTNTYDEMIKGQVERRMRKSITHGWKRLVHLLGKRR